MASKTKREQRTAKVKAKKSSALPAAQFCMICLNTNCNLNSWKKYGLGEAYKNVTGKSLDFAVSFVPKFCTECAQRLTNSSKFKDKILRAYDLLTELLEKDRLLTNQHIKSVDRTKNHLTSTLTMTSFGLDSDIRMQRDQDVKTEPATQVTYSSQVNKENDLSLNITPKIEVLDEYKSDEEYINEEFINEEFNQNLSGDSKLDLKCEENENELSDEVYDNVEYLEDTDDWDLPDDCYMENNFFPLEDEIESTKATKRLHSSDNEGKVKKRKNDTDKRDVKPTNYSDTQEALSHFHVTELTKEQQLLDVQKRKDSDSFNNSTYKCMKCFKGFNSVTTYRTHMKRHTHDGGDIFCRICKIYVKSNSVLRLHATQSHSRRYSCVNCTYVTNHKNSAIKHGRCHMGLKFKCPHCNEEYSKKSSYLSHLRMWHPPDVLCALCGLSLRNEDELTEHLHAQHRSEDLQNLSGPLCEECDVRFASVAAYDYHFDTAPKHVTGTYSGHLDKKLLRKILPDIVECEQCGLHLNGYSSYNLHFSKQHPDKNPNQFPPNSAPLLCEQCGRSFKDPNLLRNHELMTHSRTKEFQCDICDKKYSIRTNLISHMRCHFIAPRVFECPTCGKRFNNKANTKRHILTHKLLKPFKCHLCEKTCVTASERRGHVRHAHLKQPWPKKRATRVRASRARADRDPVNTWPAPPPH